MAADISKHLDRAKRFLEKNRVEDAIEAYLAVLNDAPQHQEATQALGDLYARIDQPDRAAVFYGMLFDLLVEPRDESKALAIYNRFLKNSVTAQSPERIARYAFLQQKQNHAEEAIEQYSKAGELFTVAGRHEDALFCWERIAQLDPENLSRQLKLAEAAEHIGKNALAARTFLRAGQLASAGGAAGDALKLLGRAHRLAPQERSVALLYAQAKLRNEEPADAAVLLEPFAATESDALFLETFADALIRAGNLDRAREVLEKLLREKNAGIERLFELADAYTASAQTTKGVDVLLALKRRMFADKRQNDFATQLDAVAAKHPHSQGMLEFWAQVYNELNRETQYFEILVKLFDVYFNAGDFRKACDSLERLVDIDSYDYRNQERMEKLRGRVDEGFIKRMSTRLSKSGSTAPPPPTQASSGAGTGAPAPPANSDEARHAQALEDLIVQTEIFLQYSLQAKALERLQRIAAMFPGEEKRNARLQNLYQMANWWPSGAAKPKPEAAPPPPPIAAAAPPIVEAAPVNQTTRSGTYSAETLRDLSKISEINQKIFRQQTPRAMLNTAVSEVGSHLRSARAIAVVGAPGRPPEMSAEFCSQTLKPAPGAQVVLLLAQMEKAEPDELGGLVVEATEG
jgi:tetratricopeptide (TPR) repeat protein